MVDVCLGMVEKRYYMPFVGILSTNYTKFYWKEQKFVI